jgi:hypothetical protein
MSATDTRTTTAATSSCSTTTTSATSASTRTTATTNDNVRAATVVTITTFRGGIPARFEEDARDELVGLLRLQQKPVPNVRALGVVVAALLGGVEAVDSAAGHQPRRRVPVAVVGEDIRVHQQRLEVLRTDAPVHAQLVHLFRVRSRAHTMRMNEGACQLIRHLFRVRSRAHTIRMRKVRVISGERASGTCGLFGFVGCSYRVVVVVVWSDGVLR